MRRSQSLPGLAIALVLFTACSVATEGLAGMDGGGAPDGSGVDARRALDAARRDGGTADAGTSDAQSDAQSTDTGRTDTGPPDSGPTCDPVACGDGLFCNGVETCVSDACESPGDPCASGGMLCDEATGACVTCLSRSDCPAAVPGPWSECTYAGECAESGSRMRAVDDYQCVDGSCVPTRITETDASGCTRATEGATCTRDGNVCTDDVCSGGRCAHPCARGCTCASWGCACAG